MGETVESFYSNGTVDGDPSDANALVASDGNAINNAALITSISSSLDTIFSGMDGVSDLVDGSANGFASLFDVLTGIAAINASESLYYIRNCSTDPDDKQAAGGIEALTEIVQVQSTIQGDIWRLSRLHMKVEQMPRIGQQLRYKKSLSWCRYGWLLGKAVGTVVPIRYSISTEDTTKFEGDVDGTPASFGANTRAGSTTTSSVNIQSRKRHDR